MNAIACPSIKLCVAVDDNGSVVISKKPASNKPKWTTSDIDGNQYIYGVSCPSVDFCAAGDLSGNVLTSTNPGGGVSKWKSVNIDGSNTIESISCPSIKLCVAADGNGTLYVSTDPTGGAATWERDMVDPPADNDSFSAVTCPATDLCIAAASGTAGNILFSSTRPTGGVPAWRPVRGIDQSLPLVALACVSASYCIAEDVATDVVVTSKPTGPASAWTTALTGGEGGNHLHGGAYCQSLNLCIAVGAQNVVTSVNPLGGP
jgi:hypothetical protein